MISAGAAVLILTIGIVVFVSTRTGSAPFRGTTPLLSDAVVAIELAVLPWAYRAGIRLWGLLAPVSAATVVVVGARLDLLTHRLPVADRILSVSTVGIQLGLLVALIVLARRQRPKVRDDATTD